MRHQVRKLAGILGLITIVAFTGPATAQTAASVNSTLDTLFGSHAPYHKFFDTLQKAIAADDRQTVASLVDYPVEVQIGGKTTKIADAAHFTAAYDRIVTDKVKQAVARQTYATLFANAQGVSIGDGEIWFSGIGDGSTIKIIAINN